MDMSFLLAQQYREVFFNMLRRMGALLDNTTAPIADFPGETSLPVSVLVPVFNRRVFIRRAIESVLLGDYSDFEIVVIDNGSTDGTIEVVEAYVRRDNRIRLIRNRTNIIAHSLNIGLKAARGKYIARLDSDDEYTKDTLKEMVDFLEAHPGCALAVSYYEVTDEIGRKLHRFGVIKHLECDRNNILLSDGVGAVRVWRRSVLLEFGGFDVEHFGQYGEDYDMVLKVSEKYEIGRVHKVLYRYRHHPGNTDKKLLSYTRFRNKTLARLYAIERRAALNKRGKDED